MPSLLQELESIGSSSRLAACAEMPPLADFGLVSVGCFSWGWLASNTELTQAKQQCDDAKKQRDDAKRACEAAKQEQDAALHALDELAKFSGMIARKTMMESHCVVCHESFQLDQLVVFYPCFHKCACAQCAFNLQRHQSINQSIRPYKSAAFEK